MGKHQLRLLRFAIRFADEWHTFGTDQSTVRAIHSLVGKGLLETNFHRQFRLYIPGRKRETE